jgi:hypothetical protein
MHRLELEAGRGDGFAADHQPSGVVEVGRRDQLARSGPRRQARDEFDPAVVALLGQHPRCAGAGVDGEHLEMLLVPALDGGVRAGAVPVRGGQVLEPGEVPVDPRAFAGCAADPEGDLGVRRSGRGVRERDRRPGWVRRVGEVPAQHPPGVDPGDQQPVAVRGPPVAAVPVHRLRGDVLGQAEGDLLAVGGGDHAVVRAVRFDHPDGAAADVGDPAAGRVRPGVEHRRLGGEPPGCPLRADRPELTGEREREQLAMTVGSEPDDAGRAHPGPLAPGLLLLGHRLGGAGQQGHRVGEQVLGPGAYVERPQAVHRIVAGAGPNEEDRAAVGGDGRTAWGAEAESSSAGKLTRKGKRGHEASCTHSQGRPHPDFLG